MASKPGAGARCASPADIDTVTAIVASAFATDPLWSHALRDGDGAPVEQSDFWRILVEGALRFPSVWLAPGDEAVAVWIPPGSDEMTPEQATRFSALATARLGSRASDVFELLDRFEAAHPHAEPHYYLSLLGTHPQHRGKGTGMSLLAHTLDQIDAEHMAAYLESSNPANNERYRRVGFRELGEFAYPGDGPVVTTMWRAAR